MTSAKSLVLRLVLSVWAVAALAVPGAVRAESYVGSNVDSRVLVGLKASPDGVQAMMPEGWTSVPFPAGPLKGANLVLILIDRSIDLDAEGKPLDPASMRALVQAGMAKQTDGDAVRLFILDILTTVPERNPYGVARPADIARTLSISGPANGPRAVSDQWQITPAEGGDVTFSMDFTTGKRSWSPGEAFPFSAATPEFSRIYRYEQMVDLVVSTSLGKPASGTYSLSGTGAGLDGVLNGSEEIIAVMDVPSYVRKVFLP